MNKKTMTSFCLNCRNPTEHCLCFCPYCGQVDVCDCSLEISESDKTMMTKVYSNLLMEKQSSVTDKDDVWWRLEKWQIGRKNFP